MGIRKTLMEKGTKIEREEERMIMRSLHWRTIQLDTLQLHTVLLDT